MRHKLFLKSSTHAVVPVDPHTVAPVRRLVSALDKAGFSAEQDGRLGRYDVYRADGTPGLVQLVFFTLDAANKVTIQAWGTGDSGA